MAKAKKVSKKPVKKAMKAKKVIKKVAKKPIKKVAPKKKAPAKAKKSMVRNTVRKIVSGGIKNARTATKAVKKQLPTKKQVKAVQKKAVVAVGAGMVAAQNAREEVVDTASEIGHEMAEGFREGMDEAGN